MGTQLRTCQPLQKEVTKPGFKRSYWESASLFPAHTAFPRSISHLLFSKLELTAKEELGITLMGPVGPPCRELHAPGEIKFPDQKVLSREGLRTLSCKDLPKHDMFSPF